MTEVRTRSADDLIVKTEAEKLGKHIPDKPKEQKTPEKIEVKIEEGQSLHDEKDEVLENKEIKEELEEAPQKELKATEEDASDDSNNSETDDYGNEIVKEKLYTQEEVNRMIRDRLSRGKQAGETREEQQHIQEAAKNFQADPDSGESWETQLEQFVEKTIVKVSQKTQEKEWKQQQEESQAEFETKFSTGIQKFSDFETVVKGKPITNSMMMATRSMQDPAAFLYAACKQQPQELERISKMNDPYAQVAAIGRLEEQMKKAKLVTRAPKPAKKITGDASDKMPERSIDQLIASHAKDKIMGRR
jgi:hypothetical protein